MGTEHGYHLLPPQAQGYATYAMTESGPVVYSYVEVSNWKDEVPSCFINCLNCGKFSH